MICGAVDSVTASAASKCRSRPNRRAGNHGRVQDSCDQRSALRSAKGSGAPPGLKPAQHIATAPTDDSSRRTFRPYHALAVPRGPRPLGNGPAEGNPKKLVTTAMLRNIPNKYTQNSLLEEIHEGGFADTYDFFYLPMDVHNRANVGYAFINFLHPEDMTSFSETFTDYVFRKHPSLKIARVSPAHIQGLVENLRHFSNRAVTWSRNSQYRPIVRYKGVHRDLCELLAELPFNASEEEMQQNEVSGSSDLPEPTCSLNPEAAEFVPLEPAGSQGFTGRTTLRPDAGIFVPQAMFMQEIQELGMVSDMDPVAPPPGLEGARGFDGSLFHFDGNAHSWDEPDLSPPPGICHEASDTFKKAKEGLQEAVSQWLREGNTGSACGGSSTRSSSNETSPRSVGTPAADEKGSD